MQSDKVHLLNHGFVRLYDTMPTDKGQGDLTVSRSARVSYDAEGRPEDKKLINYLWSNGHTTPFETVVATFEVQAPIFVLRQWHRHRTQSYNELSARYRELPDKWYVPEVEQITTQSTDNKQMRTNEQHPLAQSIQEHIDAACGDAYADYQVLLDQGCPRELARGVLPVNMYSHMFATANLLNWFRFLGERLHPHAQYEIRVYAEAMVRLLRPLAPDAVDAFLESVSVKLNQE